MPSGLRERRSDARDTTTKSKSAAREIKKEITQGPMDKWVEPAIATKASFEDHNGVAYGVVEHMQPLGEPPNARVRARVRPDGLRKSLVARGAVSTQQDTPEGTPQPPTRQQVKVETPPTPQPVMVDDDEDADYAPAAVNGNKKRKATQRASKPRALQTTGEIEPAPRAYKEEILLPHQCTDEKIAAVIVEAKSRACANGQPELADSVQEVYNESKKKPRLHAIMIKVLSQTAGPDDMDEFQTYVKAAKRRLAARKAAASRAANAARNAEVVAARNTPKAETNGHTDSDQDVANKANVKSESRNSPAAQPRQKISLTVKPQTSSSSSARKNTAAKSTTTSTSTSTSTSKSKKTVAASDGSELSEYESDIADDITMREPESEPTKTTPIASTPGAEKEPSEPPRERAAARKAKEASRASLAAPQNNLKRSSHDAELDEHDLPDPLFQAKRQKLADTVQRDALYPESNERTPRTRGSARPNGLPALKVPSSPPPSVAAGSPHPSSGLSSPESQHDSPPPWTTLKKSSGTRAKTKHSPEKKHSHAHGTLSGLGGATASDSPMNLDDSDAEASDNNDFCSACAGNGQLLCCDGCERSFHFTCVDPPLSPSSPALEEAWYCYVCSANRRLMGEDQAEKQSFGLFAPLFADLRKRNPTVFSLPKSIQEHFEGVAADRKGNFTNVVHNGRKKAGMGDLVDLFKLRDNKGNILFCYHCHETSQGGRQVVQCDECAQLWHLSCLDPPLALHPCTDQHGLKDAEWQCPLHIEHELKHIEARRLYNQQHGRRLHVRKPKGAKTAETFLKRGSRNNGIIEVHEVDTSDEDSEEEFYLAEDPHEDGVILKVPDIGIKLDFIEAIKQRRVQAHHDRQFYQTGFGVARGSRVESIKLSPAQDNSSVLARHSIRDQQTALNLAQMAEAATNKDLGLGSNDIDLLIAGLVAEAPEKVVATLDHDRKKDASSERQKLEALQQLIKRRLASIAD